MCGIVGGISGVLSQSEKDFVGELLTISNLRGRWGAGAAIVKNGKNIHVVKTTSNGAYLQDMAAYREHVNHGGTNIILGHTRHPTKGELIVENSHPHQMENVTGVHNGTMDRVGQLKVGKDESDSALLYKEISELGINKALARASGAYALVYLDHQKRTLNFIRNSQRPLALAKVNWKGTKTLYWASESLMLEFILARRNIRTAEVFELPTNELWSLPADLKMKDDFTIERNVMSGSEAWPVITRHNSSFNQTSTGGGDTPWWEGRFRSGTKQTSGTNRKVGKTTFVWKDGEFVEKGSDDEPEKVSLRRSSKGNELEGTAKNASSDDEGVRREPVLEKRSSSSRKVSLGNSGSEFLKALNANLSKEEREFNDSLDDIYPELGPQLEMDERDEVNYEAQVEDAFDKLLGSSENVPPDEMVETAKGYWVRYDHYCNILSNGCVWTGVAAYPGEKVYWLSRDEFLSEEAVNDYECMYDIMNLYPNSQVIADWLDGKFSKNVPPESVRLRLKAEQDWIETTSPSVMVH